MTRVKLKKLRKIRCRGKGPSFERKICVALSKWVSNGEHSDCFWRSASSGGRSTRARSKGNRLDAHAGDIVATHETGNALLSRFVVECKHYESLELDGLFWQRKIPFIKWWERLLKECDGKREPLLIMKQNGRPELVCTSVFGISLLKLGTADIIFRVKPFASIYVVSLASVLAKPFSTIKKSL